MASPGRTRHATAALAFVCCVVFGAARASDQQTAVLERVSGTPAIFELSTGKPRHASYVLQGNRYDLPIEIETGAADSATFALFNSVIEVSPNSFMRIVAPENQESGVIQRVLQQAGSSLFRVHRGTLDRFQVETPFLVSVVKGTVFNVLVRDDGATVSLQEGRLQVNSVDASQTVELAPGDVAYAGRDGVLRMLNIDVTGTAPKTRESIATRGDGGIPDVGAPTEVTNGVGHDATPAVGAASTAGSGVASVSASVSPVAAAVAPVGNVVEPVASQVVAPVVASVVAPAVNAVVAPVVNAVVVPAIDNAVAPVVNTVVAPVVNTVVAPVVSNVVAPVVAPVVTTVVAPVVTPVVNAVVAPVVVPVAAPIVAPVVTAVAPIVAPVITPVVAHVVAPVVAPVIAPVAPVVAPLAPVLTPVTNLLGLHH